MSNVEPDEFVQRELRIGRRKRIEWWSLQGLAVLALAIGAATYLRETVSPAFQVGVLGLLVLFTACAGVGLGAGIIADRYDP